MAAILVVDDYSANREFLVTLLGYAGYLMLEAVDGTEALNVVRAERPDLVIADLVMPTMDGYEFVRQLRADPALAHTLVIFCTATYQQAEAWQLAQACGVHHILTKPAEPEVVLRVVAEALAPVAALSQPFSSEEFHKEHLRVLTDKLFKQVQALEREVAERKQLEATLQQERDLLEVTLTSIGDGVIAADPTAALMFINPVAEMLTGWPTQETKGRKFEEIFHIINEETRQSIESPVEKVLREGKVVELTNHILLISRDGKEIPIAVSGAPIQSKSGQVRGVVVVFHDITERKQAEAVLICAKEAAEAADRTKNDFLATMSHELRTPLNVLLGYIEIFLDGEFGEVSPKQAEVLRRMDQNSRVLSDLITMVLDLNRLDAGQLPVEVNAVRGADLLEEIRAEMQGLCDQSQLPFIWKVEEGLPVIHTDSRKLKVVIKNLVGNAIKFTEKGSVTIDAHARNGGMEITVTDTGIGIPPEAQALIFEPFRQVSGSDTRLYSGSGLGLHIVQRLLELLEGTVMVESELGRGSTFRVWVPQG